MIRWAFADTRRPLTSTPRRFKSSSSPISTPGSITTPFPTAQVFPGYRIPEGMRWNLNTSPSRTMVWPALLPPWKRTTMSARSASRSVTFPFPSSPHWAPTMTVPGMDLLRRLRRLTCVSRCRSAPRHHNVIVTTPPPEAGCFSGHPVAEIVPEQGEWVAADLDQAGDGAGADLLLELVLG